MMKTKKTVVFRHTVFQFLRAAMCGNVRPIGNWACYGYKSAKRDTANYQLAALAKRDTANYQLTALAKRDTANYQLAALAKRDTAN